MLLIYGRCHVDVDYAHCTLRTAQSPRSLTPSQQQVINHDGRGTS